MTGVHEGEERSLYLGWLGCGRYSRSRRMRGEVTVFGFVGLWHVFMKETYERRVHCIGVRWAVAGVHEVDV